MREANSTDSRGPRAGPGTGPATPLAHEDLALLRLLIRSICNRLGVDAPIQAVVWAARRGLL